MTNKDASIIVGHPRQELKFEPALKHKTPKACMSTGACTVNNYRTNLAQSAKSSSRAKEAHQFGAVIVEVENDDIFHFRQVQSVDGCTFTDLYAKYTPTNVTLAKHTTLVMGDSHAGATDKALLESILVNLVSYANIDEIVLHDLCDARAVSPHDRGKIFTQIDKVANDKHLLKKNFNDIVDYLNKITALGVRVVVVASNHDDHLNRMLESLDVWIKDYANASTMIDMAKYYYCRQGNAPLLQFCVENLADLELQHPELIRWLAEDESYERHGCEMGQHGHRGSNGSRGSIKQYRNAVGNCVIGHSHSAGITGKAFQVGTTSELDQGYNKGLSSWTRTCCLVHEDGTKQHINFIPDGNGKYTFRIAE